MRVLQVEAGQVGEARAAVLDAQAHPHVPGQRSARGVGRKQALLGGVLLQGREGWSGVTAGMPRKHMRV